MHIRVKEGKATAIAGHDCPEDSNTVEIPDDLVTKIGVIGLDGSAIDETLIVPLRDLTVKIHIFYIHKNAFWRLYTNGTLTLTTNSSETMLFIRCGQNLTLRCNIPGPINGYREPEQWSPEAETPKLTMADCRYLYNAVGTDEKATRHFTVTPSDNICCTLKYSQLKALPAADKRAIKQAIASLGIEDRPTRYTISADITVDLQKTLKEDK